MVVTESSEARAGPHSSGSLCPGTCSIQPGLNHQRLNCRWVHVWDFKKHLILVRIYMAGTTPLVCMGTYEAVCGDVYTAALINLQRTTWGGYMWCLVMSCRSTQGCFRTGSSSTGHIREQEVGLENIVELFQVRYSLKSKVPENWRCIKTWDNFGELFLAGRQNGKFKCSV